MAHENLPWSLIEGRERADDPRFWPAAELSEATFEGALIVDVDLSAAELIDATFTDCTLARLDLRDGQIQGATFKNCTIYRCDLRRAQFEGVTFENVIFDRCDLTNSNFSESNGTDLTFSRCDAPNADFSKATIAGRMFMCDVSGANFDDANLDDCPLTKCFIRETTPGTALSRCLADGIDAAARAAEHNAPWFLVTGLRADQPGDVDLEDTHFFEVDLKGAAFDGKTLKDTHFVRCELGEASFSGATLDNVWFWDCDVSHISLAAASVKRATFMHSRGSVDAAGASIHALHIEQGEHAESNFEAATVRVGSINMTDLRGSNLKNADLTIESYMADYTGSEFDGTDVSGIAAERSHFDDGIEASEMADSKLNGNEDAGEILGGIELRRALAALAELKADEAAKEPEPEPEAPQADEPEADAPEEPKAEEPKAEEPKKSEKPASKDDKAKDDDKESETKPAKKDSKKEKSSDKETALAKKEPEEPKGFFAKLIAFFKSLFGG